MDAIYPKWKEALLAGDPTAPLGTNVVYVALIDPLTYTYTATDEFLADLSGQIGSAVPLAGATFTDGVFDAFDVLFPSVPAGTDVGALVFYTSINGGDTATSRLIFYLESVTGFPYTPTGANYEIDWDAAGIFTL